MGLGWRERSHSVTLVVATAVALPCTSSAPCDMWQVAPGRKPCVVAAAERNGCVFKVNLLL